MAACQFVLVAARGTATTIPCSALPIDHKTKIQFCKMVDRTPLTGNMVNNKSLYYVFLINGLFEKKNSKGQEKPARTDWLMRCHASWGLESWWEVSLPRMLYRQHNAEVNGGANSRRWTFQAYGLGQREMNGLPYLIPEAWCDHTREKAVHHLRWAFSRWICNHSKFQAEMWYWRICMCNICETTWQEDP